MARFLVGHCRCSPAGSPTWCRCDGSAQGAPAAALVPPLAAGVPELLFAAVRPGFVAACMVDSAGSRAGCANARAVWNGFLRARRRQAGARSPMLCAGAHGVSRPTGSALQCRASRNRQMEHLVQVAVSVRGGVRRGSGITLRESTRAGGLILATLSSESSTYSNIFRFVMT
jgi:hypothetical protein